MNTLNETGPHAGRYRYRTHEVSGDGAVSRTDLWTGETVVISEDPSYTRLDGLAWTPWHTLLFAEETSGGRIFEYFPASGQIVDRSNRGLRAHEGVRVDPKGISRAVGPMRSRSPIRVAPVRPSGSRCFDNPDTSPSHRRVISWWPRNNGPGGLWFAKTGPDVAASVVRFASLRDCGAKPTGISFDRNGRTLFVNVQHASWEGNDDLLVAIRPSR